MTLKAYIWGMRIITLLSISALAIVVNYIDPETSGIIGLTIFYLVIFFVFSGIFNLLLIFIRRKILGSELAAQSVGLSFRQGFLLAIMFLGFIILKGLQMLIWWDVLLVIAGVFLLELFFLSRD